MPLGAILSFKKLKKLHHIRDLSTLLGSIFLGACYFEPPQSEWDTLARGIALNHHEHWDRMGYPGAQSDVNLVHCHMRAEAWKHFDPRDNRYLPRDL
jgi:hypothetical protein